MYDPCIAYNECMQTQSTVMFVENNNKNTRQKNIFKKIQELPQGHRN
jgi:hypothetical protein